MEKTEQEQLKKEILNFLSLFANATELEKKKTQITEKMDETRKCVPNLRTLTNVIEMASEHNQYRKEQAIIPLCASFLWLFEGLYVGYIDLFCFLLVAVGHDLFNPIRRQYAHSFQEITTIDLSTKFLFLKEHKFGMLIREQDKKLRNRIAHHDFVIKDGKLIVVNEIDIQQTWNDLCDFVINGLRILKECLEEYTKS
jgi:hypothetical protein